MLVNAASPASAISKITFLRTGVITCQSGTRDSGSVLDDWDDMGVTAFPDEFLRTPKTTIQGGVLRINVNNNHYQ